MSSSQEGLAFFTGMIISMILTGLLIFMMNGHSDVRQVLTCAEQTDNTVELCRNMVYREWEFVPQFKDESHDDRTANNR